MESYEQMSNWSSYPQQQLLQENWRGYLNEQAEYDHYVRLVMEQFDTSDEELEKDRSPAISDKDYIDITEVQNFFDKLKEEFGFGLELTGKFGAGITGLARPLSALLKNEGLVLNEEDIILICTAAVTYAITSKEMKELVQMIKERNLTKHYSMARKALDTIRQVAKTVLGGMVIPMVDLAAYTILFMPIINSLTMVVTHKGITSSNLTEIIAGVASSIIAYGAKIGLQSIKDKLKE
jgi:hypothetical protein